MNHGLNRWKGLGKRSPFAASTFALFLLAFAGIPLTSGFIGKFSIFSAAYENGERLPRPFQRFRSVTSPDESRTKVTTANPPTVATP